MSGESDSFSGMESNDSSQGSTQMQNPADTNESEDEAPLSVEREAALIKESDDKKAAANALFAAARYSAAVEEYERALALCPHTRDYETAVLNSNLAACHIKMREWKMAMESANQALDSLEKISPMPKTKSQSQPKQFPDSSKVSSTTDSQSRTDSSRTYSSSAQKQRPDPVRPPKAPGASPTELETPAVVELPEDEEEADMAMKKLELDDQRKNDVLRIRSKALMRRAQAKSTLGGWANLQGAEEDYKILAISPDRLSPADRRTVTSALQSLPPRIKVAQETEMGEMMGKLKELGNGLLKPFGLSTDMFKMTKDEKTGGYSMNMGS